MVKKCNVLFQPDNVTVTVEAGVDLLTAVRRANLEIKCSCGGDGTCGKCLLRVVSGAVSGGGSAASDGWSLACQTRVAGDVVVEIPAFSRITGQQVLLDDCYMAANGPEPPSDFAFDPLCRKVALELPPPSLADPGSDAGRLLAALKKAAGLSGVRLGLTQLRNLPQTLRQSGWRLEATYAPSGETADLVSLDAPDGNRRLWGLAVDVGTTTVAACLVDLQSGAVAGKAGTHNRQATFGDDVISRIIYAGEEPDGVKILQRSILDTINGLIAELGGNCGVEAEDIRAVVAAGNTTMAHLLLGIDPRYIRLEPYVPAASRFPAVRGRELGLRVHPEAVIHSFPAVASYVGGDIVAGTLINGMANETPLTIFIDIGTNGEMVLGNKDWLVSCSCSAGPAFEGSGITCGTRATPGAIERIAIDRRTWETTYSTIGGAPPVGICGSGLIDALAKLREAGIIDRAGKMQAAPTPRSRTGDAGAEFVLAWAAETGHSRDIVITEADVKNLLRAKGAVYAGLRSLLRAVDMDLGDIERVYIAGGFGSCLNIRDAVKIGLLPDIGTARYRFIGNASIKGAHAALVSRAAWEAAEQLAERITYIELSADNVFMDEFISALFLPHTDLHLFPSVDSRLRGE